MDSTVQTIGPHRVRHGDLMDGLADLMRGDRASIVYTDPPWGDGALKMFATMDRKANGPSEYVTPPLDAFLRTTFDECARYAENVVLVEYGVRWRNRITEHGRRVGLTPVAVAEPVYSAKDLPLHLHLFAKDPGPIAPRAGAFVDAVRGTKGMATLRAALDALGPAIVGGGPLLDPCCGLGYSARAAVRAGVAFRGNELNRARLDKTVAILRGAS